jgi:hypothetical protein
VRYLTYAYLLRVPLLVALILPFFTHSALNEHSYIYFSMHGLFDLTVFGLGIVSAQILLLGTTLAVVTNLVIQYGPQRFGVPASQRASVILSVIYALVGLHFLVKAFVASVEPIHLKLLAMATGCAATIVLVVFGWLLWDMPSKWLGQINFLSKAGPGYLDPAGRLLPGHIFASFCCALLL